MSEFILVFYLSKSLLDNYKYLHGTFVRVKLIKIRIVETMVVNYVTGFSVVKRTGKRRFSFLHYENSDITDVILE